jgi:peroxiredoxin family protein
MKKIIFSVVIMASLLGSCKQNSTDTTTNHSSRMNDDTMMMDNDSTMRHKKSNLIENSKKVYACSMHADVVGEKDKKCFKCGMKLTEPVPDKKE